MDKGNPRSAASMVRESLRDLILRQFALYEAPHRAGETPPATHGAVADLTAHTPADIYKCLHQGEFGIGHSIDDPSRFGQNLAQELLRAKPVEDTPILEDVSLDASIFRINLRPFRARFQEDENRACALLLQACLESAEIPLGKSERFLATLAHWRDLNAEHAFVLDETILAFPRKTLDEFLSEVAAFVQQYKMVPVLSHSVGYKKLNDPSYRVVDRETLEKSSLAVLLQDL